MRPFSTAVSRLIRWTLKGTTEDVTSALDAVEQAVKTIPALADKVEKGTVNGNPHPTTYADGTQDPLHISGVLGKGNLKGSKKATSFHYYPNTGELKFSDKKYPAVRAPLATQASSQSSVHAFSVEPDWIWDENVKKYRYWNGLTWIWQGEPKA